MVCASSKGEPNRLIPILGNIENNSVLVSFVDVAIGRNDRKREVVNRHFRILIEDGSDTNFLE